MLEVEMMLVFHVLFSSQSLINMHAGCIYGIGCILSNKKMSEKNIAKQGGTGYSSTTTNSKSAGKNSFFSWKNVRTTYVYINMYEYCSDTQLAAVYHRYKYIT